MYLALFLSALVAGALSQTKDGQYVKSVKGGGGGWQYNPSVNYDRFYGQGTRQNMTSHGWSQNTTRQINYEIGVCYIEVPTVNLARDPAHVPAGNGSRPDLSRIRTCCDGYIRNIYNYRICDPVCSHECVNAQCTAPEVCTCFPDHVMNLGGFCVPTCPIGCQNGRCAGGECLCEPGYKLDSESRFCIPVCKENCGGVGNCTSPNTCDCKTGYQSSPEGSCKPVCDRCTNGDCVGPNTCRCHPGYVNERAGTCVPQCTPGCGPTIRCVAPNVCESPLTTTTSTTPATHVTNLNSFPLYSGNQVRPNPYPGYHGNQGPSGQPNSYPGYPGNQGQSGQPTSYPGYPGNQVTGQPTPYPGYPGNQGPSGQSTPYPGYPGNQGQSGQPTPYPGYPGNQGPSGQSTPYPGYPGNQGPGQPTPYPGYPGNQGHHPGYDNQGQPNPYPGYPGQRYPSHPDQYPGHQDPSYPLYPGNQVHTPSNKTLDTEDMCAQPCINAVCVGLNTCRCRPGYNIDRNDPTGTRCLPHCIGGCVNGVCSAPNFCICNMGYYKDTSVKGRPTCVKHIR